MAEAKRHVVITGAAGGIGRALVRTFVDAGWGVVASDIAPPPKDLGGDCYVLADLGRMVNDEEYAADVFARVERAVAGGLLGALINNAAVQRLGSVEQLDREDWQRTFAVNVIAPFLWTQALVPAIERARGCVVNISSVHARLTKPGFCAYATSKAALSGLTRALAVDLGARVRVHAIEPAAIETPMLSAGFAAQPGRRGQLEDCHPVGRVGRPDEVAALVLRLAEARDGFMHGACIALDGGIGNVLHDPT